MVLAVDPSVEAEAIDVLQQNSQCRSAACIGRVVEQRISPVTIHRMLGREQPLDETIRIDASTDLLEQFTKR